MYNVINVMDYCKTPLTEEGLEHFLENFTSDGWELVAVCYDFFIFRKLGKEVV